MVCSRLTVERLCIAVLCLFATLCWADASVSAQSRLTNLLSYRGGDGDLKDDASAKKSKWSSFFTVDPSKVLSVLVNRGGLLLPKSVEKELLALGKVLHVNEAGLNLVERQLVVKNFTVSVPGSNRESLRVGRVHVTWDSYTKPCVDIEVEDVDVLIEFVNLMLTRNNWNELEDAGFPPAMEDSYDQQPASGSSTFIRIGSIQLSGNVTSEIRSRPLDRSIADVAFPMDAFDELNAQIRNVSEVNLAATGRRGCTTDQVYDIIQAYFMGKLRKFLQDTAYDVSAGSLSEDGSKTVQEAKKLFASARTAVKRYADDASKKTGDNIEESLANRLEKLGVPSSREKLSALRELSSNAARNIDAKSLAGSQLNRLREALQNRADVDRTVDNAAIVYKTRIVDDEKECGEDDSNGDLKDKADDKFGETKETVIIFPDW